MADTAAHLVDRVIPAVPVRQWVFSFPHALRFRVAFDSELLSKVLRILVESVFGHLKRRARDSGIPDAKSGAVMFIQRFGSALNLNPHAHVVVLDGVYAALNGEVPRFYPQRTPDTKDVTAVAARVAGRVAALLAERNGDVTLDHMVTGPESLYSASITGTLAMGPNAGQKVKTAGELQHESFERHGSRCAMVSGFSVHAGVSIRADDRKGLERLCRYTSRPPVAVERLEQLSDGRLSYRLKSPWRNGTTHVILDPLEFIAKLSALVPAPRANLIRYYGVFGPAASWRSAIVPGSTLTDSTGGSCGCEVNDGEETPPRRNYAWALLMARVFEFDVLKCPDCGGRLRMLAAIHPPLNTRKILESMGLPSRAPPVARAASESSLE
jgi:hypothetical protein